MVVHGRYCIGFIFFLSSCVSYGSQSDAKQAHHCLGQTLFQQCRVAKNVSFNSKWAQLPDDLWQDVFTFVGGNWRRKGEAIYTVHQPEAIAFCSPGCIAVACNNGKDWSERTSFGRDIYIYDLKTRTTVKRMERIKTWRDWMFKSGVTSLAVLPHQSIAAGTCDSPFNIEIWNAETGELVKELSGNEGWVSALTSYGDTLISGSAHGTIKMWDVTKGICIKTFRAFEYPAEVIAKSIEDAVLYPVLCDKPLIKFPQKIRSLAVLRNGKLLAQSPFCLKVWDIKTMRLCLNLMKSQYSIEQCVGLWNNMVATGHKSRSIALHPQCNINIFGLHTDQDLPAHKNGYVCSAARVTSLAASPDGIFLASGGTDRVVRMWEYVPHCGYILPKLQPPVQSVLSAEDSDDEIGDNLVIVLGRSLIAEMRQRDGLRFKEAVLRDNSVRERKSKGDVGRS